MIRPGSNIKWRITVKHTDGGEVVRSWTGNAPIKRFRDDAVEIATALLYSNELEVDALIAWEGKRGACVVCLYAAGIADFDDAIYSVM